MSKLACGCWDRRQVRSGEAGLKFNCALCVIIVYISQRTQALFKGGGSLICRMKRGGAGGFPFPFTLTFSGGGRSGTAQI